LEGKGKRGRTRTCTPSLLCGLTLARATLALSQVSLGLSMSFSVLCPQLCLAYSLGSVCFFIHLKFTKCHTHSEVPREGCVPSLSPSFWWFLTVLGVSWLESLHSVPLFLCGLLIVGFCVLVLCLHWAFLQGKKPWDLGPTLLQRDLTFT
jgi:hypothetical protein